MTIDAMAMPASARLFSSRRPPTPLTARTSRSQVKVPFLPGYPSNLKKETTNIRQTLSFGAGGAFDANKVQSGSKSDVPKLDLAILETMKDPFHRYNYSARSLTHDEREAHRESARNTYRPGMPPAWLKHDRQVLRFFAYFQEAVNEDPTENFRVRRCVLYYYLEDGSIMVTEPKVENSGIPQGAFVKRHRIPKPGGGYFTHHDLRNGMTLTIYSRAFRITSCDEFTEAFYQKTLGIYPGTPEEMPLDEFAVSQIEESVRKASPKTRDIAEGKEYNELVHGGNRKNAKLQQYLENDRKVLCFKCYWDDPTRYGSRMYYTLHYYLSDDTVEMLECLARNSGRDPYPVFWRRSPLRWNPHVSPAPGMLEPEPIIYKPEDFIVGQPIMVYDRQIMLYECDEFTREFYKQYIGHDQDRLEIKEPQATHVQLTHAPHTGFGAEDDALASCLRLKPRAPRRDIEKLMNDAQKILRFEARLVNQKQEDDNRRFVVGVYVADGSISVWEPRQRNSGHTEGKFALKTRKKNPATGTWFEPKDFIVGTVVEINSTPFHLLRADEFTLSFMEENCGDFPVANVRVILSKLSGLRPALSRDEKISPEELARIASSEGVFLYPHEIVTLVRAFCEPGGKGSIPTAQLLERIA